MRWRMNRMRSWDRRVVYHNLMCVCIFFSALGHQLSDAFILHLPSKEASKDSAHVFQWTARWSLYWIAHSEAEQAFKSLRNGPSGERSEVHLSRFNTCSDAQTTCESTMDVLKAAESSSVSHREGEQWSNLYGIYIVFWSSCDFDEKSVESYYFCIILRIYTVFLE